MTSQQCRTSSINCWKPQKTQATGPDEIPAYIIKTAADELAPIMSLLFQHSMDQGEIHRDWWFQFSRKETNTCHQITDPFLSLPPRTSCMNILFTAILCIILTSTESYATTRVHEETLMRTPTAANNTRDRLFNSQGTPSGHEKLWVWPGNTTITNRRQPHGTARKSHSTTTGHQEDKLCKATSSFFPIKMIA